MIKRYSDGRIRVNLNGEFLLQKHIRENKVDVNSVIPIHLTLVFIVGALAFYYATTIGWIATVVLVSWTILGAIKADKMPSNTLKYLALTLPVSLIMSITGHMVNATYWIYYKTFK